MFTTPADPAADTGSYVQVYALQAGHLTLPERYFVHPASKTARNTVPSLAFLVQHLDPTTGHLTRIVFDLGLRNPTKYSLPIQKHIKTRQPLTTEPDVVGSLAAGGLYPEDIDYVIYSHVHWDHVGDPTAFSKSTFVVGPGSLSLLDGTNNHLRGGHSFFEPDLLPLDRTIELFSGDILPTENVTSQKVPNWHQSWTTHGLLPRTKDIFRDGSVLVVDAPGHLPGHLNLLARTGPNKYVYLAGDTCHDRRIVRGDREIGEWLDEQGHICCIHADKQEAEKMIKRVQALESQGIEVIFAHDVEWEHMPENRDRFFGATIEPNGNSSL